MSSHLSHLSQFDHTKLNAQVFRDANLVVETHLVSNLVSGQRRVPLQKVWRVDRVIGKGAFGEIRLEVLMEGSGEQRAVKRLWTSGSTLKREYQRELEALVEFSKVKYKEAAVFVDFLGWFEDADSVYLAMEYIPLGDLEHNVPSRSGQLAGSEIRLITSQILEGLKIMHSESFVHRDLKPKNVLVCRTGPQWWVKLADFGLTKRRTEDTAYRTQTGTESYMAPEILDYVPREDIHKSAYTTAVDLWALGCIVYRLASGVVPFPPGPSLYKFCENPSGFSYQSLQLEQSGIEFIQSLLAPIPRDRLNAQQALDHPWMQIGLDPSPAAGLVPFNNYGQRTAWGSTLNTEGYDTVTHAGLQSIPATGPKGTQISFAYTPPPPLHTTKEISQPPLALGTATSNHSDSANIDQSLDNSTQRLSADLPPRTWANVTATGLTPSPNRPDIHRSSTSTHASQNPFNIVSSGGPVVKPSASIAPKVAQVSSHGYSKSYGALEKSNAGTEDAPLSKSAKRKARRSKQLYENSAANPLPVVEVNSTAKPPPVVEVNPPSVLEPVRDLPTEDKSERNENLWSTADIEAEEPLSSYEKFARKGRVEMLDELRGFSQSFKLHAPLPRDLLPILSNDPVKQRHIQAKALNYIDPLKHVEPVLKYYKPSSYEPSLEDAKRSVG